MPFGLQGAPGTFQRMMDIILDNAQDYAAAYLDDIVIHSGSWNNHLLHILRRLQHTGLTIKRNKCQFAMSYCEYLGRNGEV